MYERWANNIHLPDGPVGQYDCLPEVPVQVWAKMIIEHLLVEYYALDSDSPEVQEVYDQIVELSIMWEVITPFTSFEAPPEVVDEQETTAEIPTRYQLLGNHPNPFNSTTNITFRTLEPGSQSVQIRIYNILVELVKTLTLDLNGTGTYTLTWDGMLESGTPAPPGIYVYVADFGNTLLADRMTLLK